MLNTTGLWIVLTSSVLVFVLMLLYANGVFAKAMRPILEKKKARAKKKQAEKQAKNEKAQQAAQLIEQTDASLDDETQMGDLQAIYWKKKLEKSKKEDEKKEKENANEDDDARKISFVTSFHKCVFAVFFAGVILFLPFYWDYFKDDALAFRIVKGILMSIHNTVRLFILDGDFEPIQYIVTHASAVGNEDYLNAVLCVYGVYATILYVLAPLMTAGFVLSLFKGITDYVKYQYLSRADEVYLISELNVRSIELAKDILSEKRIAELSKGEEEEKKPSNLKEKIKQWIAKRRIQKKKRIIVFAEVFAKNEENSFELISQAKNLGAYCFKRDVADLGLKRWGVNKKTTQKVYFISEQEDENVEQALIMVEACRKKEKFNTENTHFYVFATTPESEVLLDFVDNGKMKIRRVNENKDLAICTLRDYKNEIFSRAIPCRHKPANLCTTEDGKQRKTIFDRESLKLLRVVIVGLGNYGTELLKMLCWSTQMFNYVLEAYIFDKDGDAEGKMSRIAPDLLAYSEEGDGLNRPYFKIKFTSDADVTTGSFYRKLDEELPGAVTTVFVTLGEDDLNIQTAMGLRSYFGRKVQSDAEKKEKCKNPKESEWQETIPQIFSIAYSEVKNRIFNRNRGLKNNESKDYGITFIGDMTRRYSLRFIEQTELMKDGELVHCRYSGEYDKNNLKKRVDEMKSLSNGNEEGYKTYLQGRLKEYAQTLKDLERGISKSADKLLDGKDEQTNALWKAEIAEDKTAAIEREIEGLKTTLVALPQDILLQARLEECQGFVATIEKKKMLTIVYNAFKEVLKDGVTIETQKEFVAQLIQLAEKEMRWLDKSIEAGKRDYDRYEYFRASSIATAIHEEFLSTIYKDEDYEPFLLEDEVYANATEDERKAMRKKRIDKLNGDLEHLRWQAYMWAEGYRKGLYKSSIDKTHHKLVATDQRTYEDTATSENIIKASTEKRKEKK